MLNVYKKQTYVSVNQEEWIQVGYSPLVLIDEEEATEKMILQNVSFKDCCDFLQTQTIRGFHMNKTRITKKPIIVLGDGWGNYHYKEYKKFNSISCKYVYTLMSSITLEYIIKHYSANKVIQYIKERDLFNDNVSLVEEECSHV